MRILIVLHQFFPEFSGGTERVALNLARTAQRAGHHVRVLACAVQAGACDGLAASASASGIDLGASEAPVEPMLAEASAPVAADAAPEGTEGAAEELLAASGEAEASTEEATA